MPRTDAVFAGAHGTPIRYVVEGSGPLVTLVHGVGANLESWDAIAARLTPRHTVARADLRGHGRSGRITACSMMDFVDDVAGLLDVLGAPATVFAGFSLGGLIGQHVATRLPHRVSRLALISSVADRTPQERARVAERADLVRDEGIASVVQSAEDRWFTPAFKAAHPELIAARLAELIANDQASYAAAYRVFGLADEGLRAEAISCPALIMTGEHDQGSNVRMQAYLHARIEGSQLEILPGLRHSVLLEAPNLIADKLLAFFGSA